MTYADALDEALCLGWIDGVRKNLSEISYTIRFSPRKPGSVWSLINIRLARRLIRTGKMKPPGLRVFRARHERKSQIYSYEVRDRPLEQKFARRFRANTKAWKFFCSQAPSYQKVARWWIIRAKLDVTRLRRLDQLIHASAAQMRLDRFVSTRKERPT